MIRAVFFNLIYYIGTLIIGILIVPSLLLPERLYLPFIRLYFRWIYLLEKYILGLDYIILGQENLPATGPYMVAAKHQSAYETLKLPLLFNHPVVILKRELLQIPFWGWYAAKAGMIGINRKKPRLALTQMIQGVEHAKHHQRTLVIFPQGTRVRPDETTREKPYKRGIAEIYQTAQVPVIPLAVNSGLFWPRNAFLKKGGVVTFQFLPPIAPHLNSDVFMHTLEQQLETASAALISNPATPTLPSGEDHVNSIISPKKQGFLGHFLLGFFSLALIIYTAGWFVIARFLQQKIDEVWQHASQYGLTLTQPGPRLTGFPGPYQMIWSGQIKTAQSTLTIPDLRISFWPLLHTNLKINLANGLVLTGQTGQELLSSTDQAGELTVNSAAVRVEIPPYIPSIWTKSEVQKIHDRALTYQFKDLDLRGISVGDLGLNTIKGSGDLSYDDGLQPLATVQLEFSNPEIIRDTLSVLIHHPMGKSFAVGAINSMMRTHPVTGENTLPITIKVQNGAVYAGPLKVGYIGQIYWPVVDPAGVNAGTPRPLTRPRF